MPSYFPPCSAPSVWKRGRGLQAPALQHATELLLQARRAQLLVLGYVAVTTPHVFLKEALHSALGALCMVGLCSRRRTFQTVMLEVENVAVSLSLTTRRRPANRLSGAEHQAERRRLCPCLPKLCAWAKGPGQTCARKSGRRTPFGWLQQTTRPCDALLGATLYGTACCTARICMRISSLHGLQTRHSAHTQKGLACSPPLTLHRRPLGCTQTPAPSLACPPAGSGSRGTSRARCPR